MIFNVFSTSVERGGIEGKRTAKAVVNAIRKREDNCKKTFGVKKPTVSDLEGTLIVMIAAGLIDYTVKCDEDEDEIVVFDLCIRSDSYAIQDDTAWDVIPSRYFRL